MACVGNQSTPAGGRILAAKYNAIQARRALVGMGWLGAAPLRAIRFRDGQGDTGALISGMGCADCRTGLSWLGQDATVDITPAPVLTDLIAPPFVPVLTNPSPDPLAQLLAIQQASMAVNPVGLTPAGIPTTLVPPTGPVSVSLPVSAGSVKPPAVSWLQKQTIKGIPNGWIVAGGAIIVGMGALAGKRR